MEMISAVFFFYVKCISSWWWIALAVTTFVSIIIISLRDDDPSLSIAKAVQLTFVGFVTLIPGGRKFLTFKMEMDFVTRWAMLGLDSFLSFVITFLAFSFFLAPLAFAIVFGMRVYDEYMKTVFAYDVGHYGIKQALKWKLQGAK